MKKQLSRLSQVAAVTIALVCLATPALADGGGKPNHDDYRGGSNDHGDRYHGRSHKNLYRRVRALENAAQDLTALQNQADGNSAAIATAVQDVMNLQDALFMLLGDVDAISDQLNRPGKLVEPGLYEVHTRVLWNGSWDPNAVNGAYRTFWEQPEALSYGGGSLFLVPLSAPAYGIPEPAPGATRTVRLYVNYGHQWMCNGTPTVRIGSVDFSLPQISGHFAAMAAGWSDFHDASEFVGQGHTGISVFQANFLFGGPQCGPAPGTGPGRPKGSIYRVEAHYYDRY